MNREHLTDAELAELERACGVIESPQWTANHPYSVQLVLRDSPKLLAEIRAARLLLYELQAVRRSTYLDAYEKCPWLLKVI
jgi:hypothetical protein